MIWWDINATTVAIRLRNGCRGHADSGASFPVDRGGANDRVFDNLKTGLKRKIHEWKRLCCRLTEADGKWSECVSGDIRHGWRRKTSCGWL